MSKAQKIDQRVCVDCGDPVTDAKQRVRCLPCRDKQRRVYFIEYQKNRRAASECTSRTVRPLINRAALLSASTLNTGPNGFAELVNRLIRGEG